MSIARYVLPICPSQLHHETGTNVAASHEYGETAASGAASSSVWFSWTSTNNGRFNVTLEGSRFDTVLAVYSDGADVSTISQV